MNEDEERIFKHDINVDILGSEFARYLKLKAMCKEQNQIIRMLLFENGVLKSELSEAQDNMQSKIINIRSLEECKPFLKKRVCWSACHFCKKQWHDIETVNVAMFHIQGANGLESRFACDNCQPKITESIFQF